MLVENIPLDDYTHSKQINKTNIIIQANQVKPKVFQGISFGIKTKTRYRRFAEYNSVTEEEDASSTIKLPREVLKNTNMSSVRIGFIYYANNKLFQENISDAESVKAEPSQTILASTVYSGRISNLTEPVRIKFPVPFGRGVNDSNGTSECVFWVQSGKMPETAENSKKGMIIWRRLS